MDAVSASVVYMAVIIFPPICDIIDKTVSAKSRHLPKFLLCNEDSTPSLAYPFLGFLLQLAGTAVIALHLETPWLIALFIVGATLTSIKYWENYVSFGSEDSKLVRRLKRELQLGRTKVSCLTSLWKIIITFLAVITIFTSRSINSSDGFKSLFNNGMSKIKSLFGDTNLGCNELCNGSAPFLLAVVNITCSYVCYKASKSVCVIFCQRFGFSLPMLLLPLATTGTLVGIMHKPSILRLESCDFFFSDWCIRDGNDLVTQNTYIFIAFFLLYISIILITRHVWAVNGYRHGETTR